MPRKIPLDPLRPAKADSNPRSKPVKEPIAARIQKTLSRGFTESTAAQGGRRNSWKYQA
ncbi:MAG: hypothetical protein M1387_03010 [Thaumarchaeota archaeon]|nr:hypothetical protein [Nitrososphaerota archaeon]